MGGGLGYIAGGEVTDGRQLRSMQYQLMDVKAKNRSLHTALDEETAKNRSLKADVMEKELRSRAYKETLEEITAEMAELQEAFKLLMWKPRKHDSYVAPIRREYYRPYDCGRRMRTVKAWVHRNAGPFDDVVDGPSHMGAYGRVVADGDSEPKSERRGSIVADGESDAVHTTTSL